MIEASYPAITTCGWTPMTLSCTLAVISCTSAVIGRRVAASPGLDQIPPTPPPRPTFAGPRWPMAVPALDTLGEHRDLFDYDHFGLDGLAETARNDDHSDRKKIV